MKEKKILLLKRCFNMTKAEQKITYYLEEDRDL